MIRDALTCASREGALVLVMASLAIAASGPRLAAEEAKDEEDEQPREPESPSSIPTAQGPLYFAEACRPGARITIAAVGDIVLHSALQRQAYAVPTGHHSLWAPVEPLLRAADVTWANLEGPCANGVNSAGLEVRDPGRVFDWEVYSSYPMFNYHPSLLRALTESGVDVVSTANNHALDRRDLGADRTIDQLRAVGLNYAGTRRTNEPDAPWFTLTDVKGVRIAWVACASESNIPDPKKQILYCNDGSGALLSQVQALSTSFGIDAVIVTPHWGAEFEHRPRDLESSLAHAVLEAGATAVIGTHPHVVQPWEKYVTHDHREGFVMYSLGNFVSGQTGLDKQSSLILYLGLTKGADGAVTINGVRHVPLEMHSAPYNVDRAVGASLSLTTRILGIWNRVEPDERVVTNPACD